MFEDMEKKGIVFELQWKTGNIITNGEEFASIGIWEVEDTSLDWTNFKPYLCQSLGNVENLAVSYLDSDGDLIPIESDCEFQEALKYARKKAARGEKLILKIEKVEELPSHSKCSGVIRSCSPICGSFFKDKLKMNTTKNEDPFHMFASETPMDIGNAKVKGKAKASESTKQSKNSDTTPPPWFKKYMQKMKREIVDEVTGNLTIYFSEMLDIKLKEISPTPADSTPETSEACAMDVTVDKSTKKVTEESAPEPGKIEIRDKKLLKKIEKLRRREKKLDYKKEKLEQKSKKIAERKEKEFLSKIRLERAGCKRPHCDGFIRKYKEAEKIRQKKLLVNETPVVTPEEPEEPILAFKVLSNEKRTHKLKRGCRFLKKWKVMNTGNVPWTDETEVKLSWGNAGLEPASLLWKCPPLQPGEEGEIVIKFHAPDFPGIFESHWNLFHKNVRFGEGIRVVIAVDLITSSDDEPVITKERITFCSQPAITQYTEVRDDESGKKGSIALMPTREVSPLVEKIFSPFKTYEMNSTWESLDNDEDEENDEEDDEKEENKIKKGGECEIVHTYEFNSSFSSTGSDSDDNFVVVPMPPCFRIDVPLCPGDGFVAKDGPMLKNIDCKRITFGNARLTSQSCTSSDENVETLETASPSHGTPMQEQNEVSCDTGEVISKQATPFEMPLIADLKQLNVSEPPEVSSTQIKSEEPDLPPPLMPTPAPAPNSRPAPVAVQSNATPASDHAPKNPSSRLNGSSQNGGPSTTTTNIPTSQARPRPIDLMPPALTEVWTEAMNATTTALNTAFTALDSILGPSVSPGCVYSTPTSETQQENPRDPKMVEDLSQLTSMGFCNIELNEALLRVHNHNIAEVVELLLDRQN